MKRDLTIYAATLFVAIVVKYFIEIKWASQLALGTRPLLPWIIDAVLYGTLGGVAWAAMRWRSIAVRLLSLAFLAALPNLAFEITHGSDTAYPYIGLLLIVPHLVWVGVGAGFAALLTSRIWGSRASP